MEVTPTPNPDGHNPYVGPRTYTRAERHLFFGREREARDLLSLVVSERLVLFYALSGAGKSSLINTNLIPDLEAEGFEVLPVGRVSGQTASEVKAKNIFVYNLLLTLDQAEQDPAGLTELTLSAFLDNLVRVDGKFYYNEQYEYAADEELKPRVLIIDQFEEILTTNLEVWQQRTGFFEQLGQALQADDQLWVLLAMREDYVAALDPYVDYLPGQLRARYYMQRMGHEAALEAVKKPVAHGDHPFTDEAAQQLVDNLRQIRVQGSDQHQPGQFVEPVQLQVVCYQLWENLKHSPPGPITMENLEEVGDVDTALAAFYEQALKEVVDDETWDKPKLFEANMRHWFDNKLITEAETRGMVYRGKTDTGGIPTQAADLLAAKYLLRSETRAGATWYELTHDRFVQPIRKANREWRLVHVAGVSRTIKVLLPLTLFFGISFLCALIDFSSRGDALNQVRTIAQAQGLNEAVQAIDGEIDSTLFTGGNLLIALVMAAIISWVAFTGRNLILLYGGLLREQRYGQLFSQIWSDIRTNTVRFIVLVVVGFILLGLLALVFGE